ncbi:MAG: protein translocase subunit SecF [Hyphomonas sp.]|uniref:protein translocase subunit SecF n=1 Tax=Hyphomonas sp. TaxID=87 RepID=UPI001E188887|nr:protein translocase subunit SecF [Hyphomonas sp.]MBA4225220.1 protein translocase subunit SecF [Hyphomonas sp.]
MLIKYWPKETKIPFMRYRYVGVVLSVVMMIASVYLVMTRGLNLGVDFAGGSVIELRQTEQVTVPEVRSRIQGSLTVNSATNANGELVVIRFGDLDQSLLGPEFQALSDEDKAERASAASNTYVVNALKREFNLADADILRNDSVGPKVSSELFREGMIALGVATIMMFLYIAFRYTWSYAVGGIAALVHDAIGTIGLFSLLQLEFDLTTIAALLTIIGYSVNDSVVVFDRIREIRRKYKQMPATEVIDIATNQTLSRTFLTGGTTIIAVLAIAIFGGPVLQGMSVAMIWGIIIGTYSSIYFAAAIVLMLGVDINRKPVEDTPGFEAMP